MISAKLSKTNKIKPSINWLIFVFIGTSFECRCAKSCSPKSVVTIKLNRTEPVQPRGVYSNKTFSSSNMLSKAKLEKLIPIAKQGGSACYPSACMNGGTCFTNTNPTKYATFSDATTTSSNYNPPICVS